MEARKTGEAALRSLAEQKAVADQKAVAAEEKAELATKETTSMAAALELANLELVELKGKLEAIELDPFLNVEYVGEFGYYLAYADVIRTSKKGGLEVGPLVEAFKLYVSEHPLDPVFMLPFLDLSTKHGVDLSWYPMHENLVEPETSEDASQEEPVVRGDQVPENAHA
ncbi:hypothetical protein OROGR_023547 [Orobanche gracilis]